MDNNMTEAEKLIAKYTKLYKGLNQKELKAKNPSLLNKMRYRLGAEELATVVPRAKISSMTEAQRRKYNKDYYQKNKDDLLDKKRGRYSDDSDYKKLINANTKRRRDNKKSQDPFQNQVDKWGNPFTPTRMVTLYGNKMEVFTINQLSQVVGKRLKLLLTWEENGVLPYATAEDEDGNRWYSARYVDWAQDNIFNARAYNNFGKDLQLSYDKACKNHGIDTEVERL